ncbi:hypothetical protein P879_10732 [Paragonimus westermani]|uniref:WD repeat-containing protein 86 n=1 Tax=Paragonimus westermani TaxID=34504 RepID=A0A8T0DCT5_9TREM|nr:hypothetical protein P879_10732 [Paragonimus westermani]
MGGTSSILKCTTPLQACEGHTGGVNCLAVSTDGNLLASGSDDCTIRLWKLIQGDQTTKGLRCDQILAGHTNYVTVLVFHQCYLISGSADRTLKKWNLQSGQCYVTFKLHEDIVNTITCANNYVFSGSNDRTATCWNLETGDLVHQFTGHTHPVTAIAYFGTNKMDNCGSQDADSVATVLSSRFGPRECVYTGSADRTAKAWSVRSGKCTLTFKGHNGALTQIKLDRDGKLLYTASLDGTVRSWHTETAKPQYVFEGHKSAVVTMDLHDKMLCTGSTDGTAKTWLLSTAVLVRTYPGAKRTVNVVRMKDNDYVVAVSEDGHVRWFDERTGILCAIYGDKTFQCCNAFEMIGEFLVTTANDGVLYVWERKSVDLKENRLPDASAGDSTEKHQSHIQLAEM